VLIGDGQALVHAGFRVLLEAGRRVTVAGKAATGEARAVARPTRPDEVRIDAPLPGLYLEATARISAAAVVAMMLLTKTRVKAFNELVTTATMSDTANRAPAASRARIVAEADDTRRRIERALHDGTQQRLVTLALELQAVKNAVPSERPDLLVQLTHIEDGLTAALEEPR
jgi:signal transduction histidine kinase